MFGFCAKKTAETGGKVAKKGFAQKVGKAVRKQAQKRMLKFAKKELQRRVVEPGAEAGLQAGVRKWRGKKAFGEDDGEAPAVHGLGPADEEVWETESEESGIPCNKPVWPWQNSPSHSSHSK